MPSRSSPIPSQPASSDNRAEPEPRALEDHQHARPPSQQNLEKSPIPVPVAGDQDSQDRLMEIIDSVASRPSRPTGRPFVPAHPRIVARVPIAPNRNHTVTTRQFDQFGRPSNLGLLGHPVHGIRVFQPVKAASSSQASSSAQSAPAAAEGPTVGDYLRSQQAPSYKPSGAMKARVSKERPKRVNAAPTLATSDPETAEKPSDSSEMIPRPLDPDHGRQLPVASTKETQPKSGRLHLELEMALLLPVSEDKIIDSATASHLAEQLGTTLDLVMRKFYEMRFEKRRDNYINSRVKSISCSSSNVAEIEEEFYIMFLDSEVSRIGEKDMEAIVSLPAKGNDEFFEMGLHPAVIQHLRETQQLDLEENEAILGDEQMDEVSMESTPSRAPTPVQPTALPKSPESDEKEDASPKVQTAPKSTIMKKKTSGVQKKRKSVEKERPKRGVGRPRKEQKAESESDEDDANEPSTGSRPKRACKKDLVKAPSPKELPRKSARRATARISYAEQSDVDSEVEETTDSGDEVMAGSADSGKRTMDEARDAQMDVSSGIAASPETETQLTSEIASVVSPSPMRSSPATSRAESEDASRLVPIVSATRRIAGPGLVLTVSPEAPRVESEEAPTTGSSSSLVPPIAQPSETLTPSAHSVSPTPQPPSPGLQRDSTPIAIYQREAPPPPAPLHVTQKAPARMVKEEFLEEAHENVMLEEVKDIQLLAPVEIKPEEVQEGYEATRPLRAPRASRGIQPFESFEPRQVDVRKIRREHVSLTYPCNQWSPETVRVFIDTFLDGPRNAVLAGKLREENFNGARLDYLCDKKKNRRTAKNKYEYHRNEVDTIRMHLNSLKKF